MDFWNEQADQLEKALLDNAPALVSHFLRTASAEAVAELAGDALPASENTRSSVIAALTARLDQQAEQQLQDLLAKTKRDMNSIASSVKSANAAGACPDETYAAITGKLQDIEGMMTKAISAPN